MSRWFRFYDDALNDPKVQRLSPRAFKQKLMACSAGEANEFSPFLRPYSGRPSLREWAALRTAVFQRDDFTCRYCGARGGRLECDHVHPVSRGGDHSFENLVTACFRCNRSKRNKTVQEWIGGHV